MRSSDFDEAESRPIVFLSPFVIGVTLQGVQLSVRRKLELASRLGEGVHRSALGQHGRDRHLFLCRHHGDLDRRAAVRGRVRAHGVREHGADRRLHLHQVPAALTSSSVAYL